MSAINFGIVGYGMATTVLHIPLITNTPGAKVYAVVQRASAPASGSTERGPHVSIDHPDVKHYQDTSAMFRDPLVHVALIATPSPGHYGLVKEALESGKHVLVEKPFCPTSQECTSLIKLAESKDLLLTVFHNRRLDSDFLTLKKALVEEPTSSLFSPLIELSSHYDRYRPDPPVAGSWKLSTSPGTGIIYDLGSHLIDQALVLFGMPTWIWAITPNQRVSNPATIDDSFTIMLYYSSREGWNGGEPLQVELKSTMISPTGRQLRFDARGWKASYKKYHLDMQEEQLKAHSSKAPKFGNYGAELEKDWPILEYAGEEPAIARTLVERTEINGFTKGRWKPERGDYVELIRNLVTVVNKVLKGDKLEAAKNELFVKPEEARDVIRVIELAKESAVEGSRIYINAGTLGY